MKRTPYWRTKLFRYSSRTGVNFVTLEAVRNDGAKFYVEHRMTDEEMQGYRGGLAEFLDVIEVHLQEGLNAQLEAEHPMKAAL